MWNFEHFLKQVGDTYIYVLQLFFTFDWRSDNRQNFVENFITSRAERRHGQGSTIFLGDVFVWFSLLSAWMSRCLEVGASNFIK